MDRLSAGNLTRFGAVVQQRTHPAKPIADPILNTMRKRDGSRERIFGVAREERDIAVTAGAMQASTGEKVLPRASFLEDPFLPVAERT